MSAQEYDISQPAYEPNEYQQGKSKKYRSKHPDYFKLRSYDAAGRPLSDAMYMHRLDWGDHQKYKQIRHFNSAVGYSALAFGVLATISGFVYNSEFFA